MERHPVLVIANLDIAVGIASAVIVETFSRNLALKAVFRAYLRRYTFVVNCKRTVVADFDIVIAAPHGAIFAGILYTNAVLARFIRFANLFDGVP